MPKMLPVEADRECCLLLEILEPANYEYIIIFICILCILWYSDMQCIHLCCDIIFIEPLFVG